MGFVKKEIKNNNSAKNVEEINSKFRIDISRKFESILS